MQRQSPFAVLLAGVILLPFVAIAGGCRFLGHPYLAVAVGVAVFVGVGTGVLVLDGFAQAPWVNVTKARER